MTWDEIRDTFLEAARSVAEMVAGITDWERPALGDWDVTGLVGHTLRAVTTPSEYLAGPEPDHVAVDSAAGYFVAYLRRRDADPAGTDRSIIVRGREAGAVEDPAGAFAAAVVSVAADLARVDGGRRVAAPYGSMTLADYLPTRVVELTVHGMDLARATGIAWHPPADALGMTLGVLAGIALLDGSAGDAILALTGRCDPGTNPTLLR